ncbi:MAG: hypothetical protein KF841_06010 [Phycisphaerae bacterium]|nr:hypothetical protein [Phycisphaerae bacterium]
MSPRKLRSLRRLAGFFAIGACIAQAGPCAVDSGQLGALLQATAGVATQTFVTFVSDTLFFLLDNFLVRLTAA